MTSSNSSLPSTTRTRKTSAEAINRAMARFPLIIAVLDELGSTPVPFPGDSDLRHGCDRTLTTILSELARIEPATSGKPSRAEETARGWLRHEDVARLLDADKLERIHQFIDRILGPSPQGS